MSNANPNQAIQRILCSWSRTLELDQASGESIVTQTDLDRVIKVLAKHPEITKSVESTTPAENTKRDLE